ncbi:MAG: site-specific integrase [Desulfobacterales bacterium]|nr:site-specific integrase [Desulfobacterales bacterium]
MACVTKRRGRYILDFYDNQGERRWITMPEEATKAQAKDKLREIENELAKGVYLPDKRIPTFKKVAKAWVEYKKPNLRESTWSVYKGHTKNHFKELDPLRINRINTARIEKFITDCQNKGMHILTIRKVLASLNQIFSYAVRHRYIDYNPVRDAERPRGQGGEEEKVITVLTPSKINAFLEKVKKPKYKTLFMLAIMSGARQGELLGLKWSDLDWFNNQIHIQRTFNNQKWYKPKSKTSFRKIDLGPSMMNALKKWKLACPSNELDLMFPNKKGLPINNSNMVQRYFVKAFEDAELETIRFHDLRHTYASLLIEQGENIKYIQTQLGHSNPTVTLNIYAHLIKPVNQEAAFRLEKTIFSTSGSKMVAGTKKGITS